MINRLLKIVAPAAAVLGMLAVSAPAEARCWYDGYGNRVCSPPPRYYAPPPPPVYYAPPPPRRYYAPPPRVYYPPPPPPRYYAPRPVINFGLAF
ncbi:hypothetical protein STVA_47320 [Allostella vacuolata]|nr:hypothetical protein STVA_47320 [Stella vacuolata]